MPNDILHLLANDQVCSGLFSKGHFVAHCWNRSLSDLTIIKRMGFVNCQINVMSCLQK